MSNPQQQGFGLQKKRKKTYAQISAEAPREHEAINMLRKTCKDGGQIVLAQVRNGVGFSDQVRTADALIVETWPSRGMGFTGVEYKRTRSDWLRELRDGAKGDEIARYCQGWLILAPAGLIPVEELPTAWGLWEIKGKRIFRTVAPPPQEVEPPSLAFVCAILRANQTHDPHYEMMVAARKEARAELENTHAAQIKYYQELADERQAAINEFEQATGLRLSKWSVGDAIKAAPLLMRYMKNPESIDSKLDKVRQELVDTIERIDKIKGEK